MDVVSVAAVDAPLKGCTNIDNATFFVHLKDSMYLVRSRETGHGTIGVELQSIGKRNAIQSRRDYTFLLLDIGRIRWCTKPESDTECCSIQLLASNGSSGGIAFLGEEFAVPESALDKSVVGILYGLGGGLFHTGGKADLGLPSADANTMPELVVESQRTKALGHPRKADKGAVGMDGIVEIRSEEGENHIHEVGRQVLEVRNDGKRWFVFGLCDFDALIILAYRRCSDGIEPAGEEVDARRGRHDGGSIRRCLVVERYLKSWYSTLGSGSGDNEGASER